LTSTPGSADENHVGKAGFGVDGEHDARTGLVRAHHLLHPHRQRDVQMVETVFLPIRDRAVRKQRRIALPAGFEQVVFARDVQVGLLLTGNTRFGKVCGRGTAADRDRDVIRFVSRSLISSSCAVTA
jgi:hypothetical protein